MKKSSLCPSTNDFASYGQSPMLIRSVVFTRLTKKKKFLNYMCIDMVLFVKMNHPERMA